MADIAGCVDVRRSSSRAGVRSAAIRGRRGYGRTRWTGLPRMRTVHVVTSFDVPVPFIV